MIQKNNILVQRTADYYTLGDISNAETIWFVLHGYGYLAKYFIKKFEPVLKDSIAIIAPEGLSKFYSNGVGYDGRVGASWMTKESREDEITDYINYLNQLYSVILEQSENTNRKVNVVGFSQGGATASRWVANGAVDCNNIILWSSAFPEDLELKNIPKNASTFVLFGDDDQFINEQQIADYEGFLNATEFECTLIKFEGKHDIPKDVLIEQITKNNW